MITEFITITTNTFLTGISVINIKLSKLNNLYTLMPHLQKKKSFPDKYDHEVTNCLIQQTLAD